MEKTLRDEIAITAANEVMRLCRNGDVYIRGKLLTEKDIEKILATLKVSKE